MTKVCYIRPNRTKRRVFTKSDVARIAKYAVDDGADARDIVVGVISTLGLGFVLCASAKAVNSAVGIAALITKIGGILAIGKIVDFLLTVVTNGLFKKLAVTQRYLAVIVLALAVSEGILKWAKTLMESASVITGAAELINDLCERITALKPD
jgi:hypothetical protein